MGGDIAIMSGEGFKFIARCAKRQLGEFGDFSGEPACKSGLGIQARADRCAALSERVKLFERGLCAGDTFLDLIGIARKLLAQCNGCGVLSMGTANLDNFGELFGFLIQRGVEFLEGRNKICLLYTSPSPRDATLSRMPSSA